MEESMPIGDRSGIVILFLLLALLLAPGCQKSTSFVNPDKTFPVGFQGMNGEVDSFLFHNLAFNVPFRRPAVITTNWSRVLNQTSADSGASEKVKLSTIPFVILLLDPDRLVRDALGQSLTAPGALGKWSTDFDGQVIIRQVTHLSQIGAIEWRASIEGKEPLLTALDIGGIEIDLSLGTLILISSGTGSDAASAIQIEQRQWKNNFDLGELTDLRDFNRQHQELVPRILKELGY